MELAETTEVAVGRVRPAGWNQTLRGVADIVQAERAVIVVEDAGSGRPLIAESSGPRDDAYQRTLSAAAVASMRPLMGRIPTGTALRSSELIPDHAFAAAREDTDIIRLSYGFYALAAREQLDGLTIFIAAGRPRRAGNFADADAHRLQALLPVLRETVALHQSVGVFRQQATGLTHVLESLDCGVILLDARQHPIFMNARARQLADARDGLLVGDAGLSAGRIGETSALQHAITSAIAAAPGYGLASVYIHRDAARSPLKVDILSVGGDAGPCPSDAAARAIVLLREPEAPLAFDRQALARTYDLTSREAELAILLASGHTLPSAAAALKIGLSTVRWYLKHLFEKTETHRQAELIRLVVGGFGNRSI